MLDETLAFAADVADRLGDGSALNSNRSPSFWRTLLGTTTTAVAAAPDLPDVTAAHDRADYEDGLQRDNLQATVEGLAREPLTHITRTGTPVGIITTVISGADTAAKGLTATHEYIEAKGDAVERESQGHVSREDLGFNPFRRRGEGAEEINHFKRKYQEALRRGEVPGRSAP